ncbi:MAG: hypothetical protein ACLFUQ_02395 [Candidatus Izemoplasmataceae bacterium]
MKKLLSSLMFTLAIIVSATSLRADMGPKPFLEVEINGFDEPYYYDVLIEKTPGTIEPLDSESFNIEKNDHYLEEDYPDTLNGYQDDEGFASGTLYNGAPLVIRNQGDDVFSISYFNAPEVFKVVLFNDEGTLIVSEAVTREQFSASFNYDLSGISFDDATEEDGVDIVTVSSDRLVENYRGPTSSSSTNIMLETLFRLFITLAVELGVLYLLTYRRKSTYYIAGITNAITQGILTAFTISVFYYWGGPLGGIIVFILGEAVVFLIEMIVYPILFREKSRWLALGYAILANTLSLMMGVILFIFL